MRKVGRRTGTHRSWKDSSGKMHRVGGPAEEWADGTKYWARHGNLRWKEGGSLSDCIEFRSCHTTFGQVRPEATRGGRP